ncbi:ATP-binding protein [Mesorhizobium sp.]|uniref:ATP-binding protein n=1 Tax=Mesorhizobium sp. TaxID=1871066 RepID=UPI000FE31192|nr:ATP-binding protein [Mesorhizobium sp.]RWH68282.1 MAG: sensor histidine kinase [Mesorhizobium sp.]RWL25140.1 MAG: sensor histidine kinase [Mesorhizobium sp.]RWL27645.1 MAG: sensor histidine kinase [Mesorhizobium sp.]RWL36271.1 MAG: sensor histidine kinase [Mesorhizobium sp.]RWL50959.1 MAG: sensor histidine kinase [Mesorhizobium sp.]
MLQRPAAALASTPELLAGRAQRAWLLFTAVAMAIIAAALYGAGLYGRSTEIEALTTQGRTDANLKVALLRAVLENPRALPLLLSEDQQVHDALTQRSPASIDMLNRKLEGLVSGTKASVLYVTGTDGFAIASSNWREPVSFVGSDYSFRAYFSGAMQTGTAECFALGNVSKRPGLYISRRVDGASGPLGVVVVKMEFDQLEADWHEANRPAFVSDAHGVVLITSVPSWRFLTTEPLSRPVLAEIRASQQFGDAPLVPLPITRPEALSSDVALVHALTPGSSDAEYLRLSTAVPSTSWRLDYLVPAEAPIAAAQREMRLLVLGVLVPLIALAAYLLWRRQSAQMRIAAEQAARAELERRVVERTQDLSRARDRLQAEIADHRSTEAKLQVMQQELVQANRLATLGQVAAGVAHEINQPVATIRAYADNARVFLERKQSASAEENLGAIAALTERIGSITEELKAFARKGRTAAEPVELRSVIEGAVVLLRSRFAGRLDALAITPPPPALKVMGNRLRLEQVLINLFQNALEALDGRDGARVEVAAAEKDDDVTLTVSDNGPGIPPAILKSLFTPFNTSKEKGLGLGLVISKDIVADYGGHIEVTSGDQGTRFTIHLSKAGAS